MSAMRAVGTAVGIAFLVFLPSLIVLAKQNFREDIIADQILNSAMERVYLGYVWPHNYDWLGDPGLSLEYVTNIENELDSLGAFKHEN